MRLLIVTRERAGEQIYGLGRVMRTIAALLEERGHYVVYLAADSWSKDQIRSYERYRRRLERLLGASLAAALAERIVQSSQALRLVQKEGISHLWFQDPWLVLGWWIVGGWRLSVRWGVSEHGLGSFVRATLDDGMEISRRKLRYLLALERYVLKRAVWVFCPSRSALNLLKRDIGLLETPKSWRVGRYGKPQMHLIGRETARRRLGIASDTLMLLALGRISRVKRYEQIIDALSQIQGEILARIELYILGGGDQESLMDYAKERGVNLSLDISDEVGVWLEACDLYISASAGESFGYATLEAMSARAASVVACTGAAAELCQEGARLYDGSIHGLKAVLLELLSSKDRREELRSLACKRMIRYPTWKEAAQNYEMFLLSRS